MMVNYSPSDRHTSIPMSKMIIVFTENCPEIGLITVSGYLSSQYAWLLLYYAQIIIKSQ